jgi:acetyl esterase/lipase
MGLQLFVLATAVTVYRKPHYSTRVTKNVVYASTLVHCTNQTEASTCQETTITLDVHEPVANASDGPFPIVFSVHGGGFVGGDSSNIPPNAYFAERGFVAFGINYRLAGDKGLYPEALRPWESVNAYPHASWTPYVWQVYPAVRDIKAALRWVHANAEKYNADTSSITLQGGSSGATAVIELALTGGVEQEFAHDFTYELSGVDSTLPSTNLEQPATAHGLISYWGAIFAEDLMRFKDGRKRWSSSSVPTVAFHGTIDTTVSPDTGNVLCGNLTRLGVPCRLVPLPGEKHACWNAQVVLPGGEKQSIIDYAFDAMANMSNWTVIGPNPGTCAPRYGQCGGKSWTGPACCVGGCKCTGSCMSCCSTHLPAGSTFEVSIVANPSCVCTRAK